MPIPTIFFFLIFLQTCCECSQTHEEEHAILLDLRRHWQSPPSLAHWASSDASHCSWPEIECSHSLSVIGIMMYNRNITSNTLPPFLCDLENLRNIDLSYNNFSGEFPGALLNCPHLEFLDFTKNNFNGPIPADIDRLSNLRFLYLGYNNFSGEMPAALWQLPRLWNLTLSGNQFDGAFPPQVGNLSSLKELEMRDIGFIPSVLPASLTQLTNLATLNVARTNLIGEIPEAIGSMEALELLDLSQNNLKGRIPSSLFLLKKLRRVYLYHNSLAGEIPSTFQSLDLVEFDISKNHLTGVIPEDIGKLEKLTVLQGYSNQLCGQIPESIGRLPHLKEFTFYNNSLSGPLPPDFGRYSPLEAFQVANNRLTGRLPQLLCAAGKLVGLVALHNQLRGELPVSLGNCSSLRVVMLRGNRFSGKIPAGLWSSFNLGQLMISHNLFSGNLPEKVGPNLSILEMSFNRFSGIIPAGFPSQKNLVVFKASHNLLVGSIPKNLTTLPRLATLSLHHNKLSGQLPLEIRSLKALTFLNLSNNELSGHIPATMGHLPRLSYLDLSLNHLSGKIPMTLAGLELPFLNLSSNNLTGEVPADFENPVYYNSFLSNPALCSDNPVLNLQPCYTQKTEKLHQLPSETLVLGIGIGVAVLALAFLVPVSAMKLHRQRKQRVGPKWKVSSFQKLNFTEADILPKLTEDNLIGSGGSGKVYRVAINESIHHLVAVKKIWSNAKLYKKYQREFLAEIEILSTIRHTNIVKLLCCIYNNSSSLLVYEYLEKCSLDLWLNRSNKAAATPTIKHQPVTLDWPKRLHIAVGAAQGLSYMHHHCVPPIIHCDVKTSNILLDSEFNAKIADFGLARLMEQEEPATMTAIQGSFGYMAPEFAQTVRVNEKIDVYSFGVVLLELVTGREAGDGGEHGSLVEWAWCHIQEGHPIPDALDNQIMEDRYLNEMTTTFKLGILCTRVAPSTRPSMSEVLQVLEHCSQSMYKEKNAGQDPEGCLFLKTPMQTHSEVPYPLHDESKNRFLFLTRGGNTT